MAAEKAASVSVFVFVALVLSPSTARETLIKVAPGQTVTLPCHLQSNTPVVVTEWTRPDLVPQYVLFYRDGQSDPENQVESFKDRVELKDEQMKDGDVSLVLQNVIFNDTGTYECHVWRRPNSRKRSTFDTEPISTIRLTVELSGSEPGRGHAGLVAAVVALTVLALASVVGFVMIRKRMMSQPKSSSGHMLELQLTTPPL